jgi:hypothetical protein
MNMNRKGLAPITIVLLVILGVVVIGVGAFYYFHNTSVPSPVAPVNNSSSTVATSGEPTIPGNGVPTPTSTTPIPPAITTSTTSEGFIMMPDNGPVGSRVTIYGKGLAAMSNTVTMDGMVSGSLKNIASNGGSITFTIPSSLGPNCKPNEACPDYLVEVSPRVYAVAIISPSGVTQAMGNFTVTASGTPIGL